MNLYIPWLADACRAAGFKTIEVSGWRTRGHGGFRVVEDLTSHHTATPESAPGDYPSLGIVTNGRSDLAGPLCNIGFGRSATCYVVAAGVAWHAGASAWAGFYDINDEAIGVEMESPGDGTWTQAQIDGAPRLFASLLRYMHRPASRYAGHKDVCLPVGRKIDPHGGVLGDRVTMQKKIAAILSGSGGGTPTPTNTNDDMENLVIDRVIPAGKNVRTLIALQPATEWQITIAPGNDPVVVNHVYNWNKNQGHGSGGDLPGFTVNPQEGETFTVPLGVQNCQLFTTSDDEHAIMVSPKPASAS